MAENMETTTSLTDWSKTEITSPTLTILATADHRAQTSTLEHLGQHIPISLHRWCE